MVDLDLRRASYDPKAPAGNRLHYAVQARLRDGVWECPKLPYPVNNLSAVVDVEDGLLTHQARRGLQRQDDPPRQGTMRLGDPRREPMDLHVELTDLELDRAAPQPDAPRVRRALGRLPAQRARRRRDRRRSRRARRAGRAGREGHLPRRRGELPPFPLSRSTT